MWVTPGRDDASGLSVDLRILAHGTLDAGTILAVGV
jgi:hypothetical protein